MEVRVMKKRGFSVIELLVIIAILTILGIISLSAMYQHQRFRPKPNQIATILADTNYYQWQGEEYTGGYKEQSQVLRKNQKVLVTWRRLNTSSNEKSVSCLLPNESGDFIGDEVYIPERNIDFNSAGADLLKLNQPAVGEKPELAEAERKLAEIKAQIEQKEAELFKARLILRISQELLVNSQGQSTVKVGDNRYSLEQLKNDIDLRQKQGESLTQAISRDKNYLARLGKLQTARERLAQGQLPDLPSPLIDFNQPLIKDEVWFEQLVAPLLEKGIDLAKAKDYGGALAQFNEVLETDPKNAAALNNKGVCLAALGEKEAAKNLFAEALALEPKQEEILINQAAILLAGLAESQTALADSSIKEIYSLLDPILANSTDKETIEIIQASKKITEEVRQAKSQGLPKEFLIPFSLIGANGSLSGGVCKVAAKLAQKHQSINGSEF